MCISNKCNYKTFTKSPLASLSHWIENNLNHSSGKCRDFLTVTSEFHQVNWPLHDIYSLISPQLQRNCQLEKRCYRYLSYLLISYKRLIQQKAAFT